MAGGMGIFSRRSEPRQRVEPTFRASSPENPLTPLSNPDAWLLDWSAGGVPLFGPPVTEQTAMAVSAVFRCVQIRAGLVAGLPLKIYRDTPDAGRQESSDHKLARLLGSVPFPGRPLTSFVWRELWSMNVDLWGNHYSVIRHDGAGRVVGFEPAMPWQVEVVRMGDGPLAGQNVYVVSWSADRRETVLQDNMLHVVGPGFDGVKGQSRIRNFARNAVSLARTLEEQTGRVHENAAKPSGMIELPANIKLEGKRRIEAHFNEHNAGRLNAGKPLFVDKDTKYTPMQMSPEDLNTLELRRFQIADICRFFGVPPHLVGEAAGTSAWGSGIEQLTIGFLRFTLEADLQRIEHELNLKLLDGSDYYCMFDRDALQTMDATVAASVAQTQINSGVLTINEARRRLSRPSVEGGDEPMVNSTMVPLRRALNPPAPAAPPPAKESKDGTP